MTSVLVLTHDVVGTHMAGPAIRALELCRQLSGPCSVTLASQMPLETPPEVPFRVVSFDGDAEKLRALAEHADVLILQGTMHVRFPFLMKLGKHVVADLYDPFIFETYPHMLAQPGQGVVDHLYFWDIQNRIMEESDFAICASERQRDMWVGRYCALGRLTPPLFADDASFRQLIDVVPFGLQDTPPRHVRRVLKGVVPGIRETDRVLLWGGGVWNWFDPLTAIRAIARIAEYREDVKLYFLGLKHPNPEIPEMEMAGKAVALAEELGLKDRHVFFNFGWVPYDDRQNYLLEADIGISCHFDSIETRFSFRTRVLDYLWAGLPVLTTEGDSMAELVAGHEAGHVCRYESVDDWVEGITRLLDDAHLATQIRSNVHHLAGRFRWSVVAAPLLRYCLDPHRTPRAQWSVSRNFNLTDGMPAVFRLGFKTFLTLRTGGVSALREKGKRYLLHRLQRKS